MSVRETIFEELVTTFQTILVSNGYNTDIGENVVRWSSVPITSLPVVTVSDTSQDVERVSYGEWEHTLSIGVNIIDSGVQSTLETELYSAVDDILNLVASNLESTSVWTDVSDAYVNNIEKRLSVENETLLGAMGIDLRVVYSTDRLQY